MNKAQKLIDSCNEAIRECIIIPNEWLPEDYHDQVRGGRTLARLEQLCDKSEGLTDHVKQKAAKARNIAKLAAQFDRELEQPLDYSDCEINELRQYDMEMMFVKAGIAAGMMEPITTEDLLDE